ncbi:MAG: TIGR03943 family protein, partial [Planctomycetes bacterium]|nr:TIGR03943 family protein [Planctomycetota bacterium]
MAEHDHCGHEHEAESALRRIPAYIEPATLVCLAAFLAFSFFSGRLRFFVASYYTWMAVAAAVALGAMWLARRRAPHVEACCAGEHSHESIPRPVCGVVLLVPVAIVLAVNPTQFSSEGLRKRKPPAVARDLELEAAIHWVLGLKPTAAPVARATLPKEPTLVELLKAVDESSPKAVEGQFVTVVGQCDLPQGSAERFELYRLVVTCCIADARAATVEVAAPAAAKIEQGSWIRVSGLIRFDYPGDPTMPVIHAVTVVSIPV